MSYTTLPETWIISFSMCLGVSVAFEYSTVDADITSRVDSVLNPTSGTITADSIDKLIIEKDKVDPSLTKIVCRN